MEISGTSSHQFLTAGCFQWESRIMVIRVRLMKGGFSHAASGWYKVGLHSYYFSGFAYGVFSHIHSTIGVDVD